MRHFGAPETVCRGGRQRRRTGTGRLGHRPRRLSRGLGRGHGRAGAADTETPADADAIEAVRASLRADWPNYAIVEITQPLVELAGDYADTFALRGYDSVQLAAARILQEAASEPLRFACFDGRLNKAAHVLGMQTLDSPTIQSP